MTVERSVEERYAQARERYAAMGVDTDRALRTLEATALSLQCWQGDDVVGFETKAGALSTGGIQVTGGFPGRARTIAELQGDLQKAFSLIPGRHRLNLHAMYGDFGGKTVDRDGILPEHYAGWIQWATQQGVCIDFNATCFAHPKADSGFTLSSKDPAVRKFWIDHVQRCRSISAYLGRTQGNPCIHDLWIPDGSKDLTVSRWEHRLLLKTALDEIYSTRFDPAEMKDAVESKLFGIGSESFVVGSHEFYLGYAIANRLMLCIDMGHFHPSESVADKVSSILHYSDELLLHVSRGVRWDSDHVVILDDDVRALMQEIVRGDLLSRVHLALDYFDASINRVGAWIIGARATLKALLIALLEPLEKIRAAEAEGNNFARLALLEEAKTLPSGAVWDFHCAQSGVPPGERWINEVMEYQRQVQTRRR